MNHNCALPELNNERLLDRYYIPELRQKTRKADRGVAVLGGEAVTQDVQGVGLQDLYPRDQLIHQMVDDPQCLVAQRGSSRRWLLWKKVHALYLFLTHVYIKT